MCRPSGCVRQIVLILITYSKTYFESHKEVLLINCLGTVQIQTQIYWQCFCVYIGSWFVYLYIICQKSCQHLGVNILSGFVYLYIIWKNNKHLCIHFIKAVFYTPWSTCIIIVAFLWKKKKNVKLKKGCMGD